MDKKTDVRDPDEKVVEIEMERLRAFPNHPFKVIGDSQMIELQDSIKKYGVLNPLIVRPKIEGYYEIISGHRRKYAAEKLGYKKIPVIIRMLQDDEAVVIMVDSNLQREQITPSEKAYAYKMKYDAIKKKAGRKNCSQVDHNTGKRSIDVIGELCGDSAKQVHSSIKSKRWSWKDGIVREFRNRIGTGREKGSSDRWRYAVKSFSCFFSGELGAGAGERREESVLRNRKTGRAQRLCGTYSLRKSGSDTIIYIDEFYRI